MKALLFAAGRGERLRPLTDTLPKPLVEIGGRTLLARNIEALAEAGFDTVVVNTSHLAERIHEFLDAHRDWGIPVYLSHEPGGPLETGGGMRRALPLLGSGPFLAINADILCDYPLGRLRSCDPAGLAHLVMVETPDWKARGDFELRDGVLVGRGNRSLTFAGIGVYRAELVLTCPDVRFSTVPLLEAAMARGEVTGERHAGSWHDIGTPQRLQDALKIYDANR